MYIFVSVFALPYFHENKGGNKKCGKHAYSPYFKKEKTLSSRFISVCLPVFLSLSFLCEGKRWLFWFALVFIRFFIATQRHTWHFYFGDKCQIPCFVWVGRCSLLISRKQPCQQPNRKWWSRGHCGGAGPGQHQPVHPYVSRNHTWNAQLIC